MERFAADDEAEEAALEDELESQLAEHKRSLEAVKQALEADPSSEELQEAKEALEEAVSAAEDGLLQLKRNRLLREIEAMTSAPRHTPLESNPTHLTELGVVEKDCFTPRTQKTMPQSTSAHTLDPADEASPASTPSGSFTVGSKCRFRHTDGRWYAGLVVGLEEDMDIEKETRGDSAEGTSRLRVAFLHPTTDLMQMCMFFLQGNCRFGPRCRKSHGFLVSAHALRPYEVTPVSSLPLGSSVSVKTPGSSIWQQAELVSVDEDESICRVALAVDGSRHQVRFADVANSEAPLIRDPVASDTFMRLDSDESEVEEEEEEELLVGEDGIPAVSFVLFSQGLGALGDSQLGGVETARIADWEQHTRGVASRMMFAMGYRTGMGLGKHGQGRAEPLEVKVLPAGRSLDFIHEGEKIVGKGRGLLFDETGRRRKKRGGEKSRRRKQQAEAQSRKAEQERIESGDMFGFINRALASTGDVSGMLKSSSSGALLRKEEAASSNGRMPPGGTKDKLRKLPTPARQELLLQDKKITEAQANVRRLEEMAERNRKDKAMYGAVLKRLELARGVLRTMEGSRKKHEHEIKSAETMKRWVKF